MSTPEPTADEIVLPAKRTTGETLEERLTGNAYHNILPARYLRKDADGNLIETQEDLFDRVAKNIALADVPYEADKRGVEITVRPEQLKPEHPRRDELAVAVFGDGVTASDDLETALTDRNVNKFDYDTVVPTLPDEIREPIESIKDEFQEMMEQLSFVPNSPTLMNAGDELQQLSACFVISPDDDIEDIHETATKAALIFQSGGGLGYGFWKLRPYGDPVGSTGGIASGPMTFMETFDQMCFPPGTQILTPEGQRAIESLEPGEIVIDENGEKQTITETMRRHVNEDLVEIIPERCNKPIRATSEHPFKVYRDGNFEWVDAIDLTPGDLVVLGTSAVENDLEIDGWIDLSNYVSGPLVMTDGGITINREYYGTRKGSRPGRVNTSVPVRDFATIAGWYLAEGCVVYRRGIASEVTFTLNYNENEEIEEIRNSLASFGVLSRYQAVPDRNTAIVHVENSSFAQLIEGLFCTGADEKEVPSVLWSAPVDVQAHVLEKLFKGDGYHERRGKSQRQILKLANKSIIDFVYQAGLRCGVIFSRHDREPDDKLATYSVSLSVSSALGTPLVCLFDEVDEGFIAHDRTKWRSAHPVVEIETTDRLSYKGPVYNLEVEESHTYIANDIVVHNCETIAQGGTRRGAQMAVMRVSHPDVIEFIHAKNKDVSLAHCLKLNDPDDYTYTTFNEALDEARSLIDENGRVPKHLRNAVEGHLSNFNISVGVTDDFMEAYERGDEFTFTNPRTGEPHIATAETKEMYDRYGLGDHIEIGEVLSLPASIIWDRIVDGAYENGEPGVIFLERVNKEHSFDVDEHPDHQILATNPCVTGETLISTESGLISAEELYANGVARDVVVDGRLSAEPTREASSVFKTGEKEVYKLKTREGYELRLTADHRVMTSDGWVEAQYLSPGDTVHIVNRKGAFGRFGSLDEGRVLGWLVGDGHLKHGEQRAVLNFYDEDTEISSDFAEYVNGIVRDPIGTADYEIGVSQIARSDDYRGSAALEQRIRSVRLYEKTRNVGLTENKHQIPDIVFRGSEEMARGFLQALFSADGSVQVCEKNGRTFRLASSHIDLLKQTQHLLLNFGIASRVYANRRPAHTRELPNGKGGKKEYDAKAQHELVISKDNQRTFADEIGFLLENKNRQLEENLDSYRYGPRSENYTATIEKIAPDGLETVYDLTEPKTHSFVANGLVVHNCGEQPLEENEACNLGHINLSTIASLETPDWRVWYDNHGAGYNDFESAVEAFLADAIDWDEFDHRIEYSTRFLENVVTMSDFPVEDIEETVYRMRKIGLGIMGLAQLYIQLGVRYGSDPGNEIARQLMMHINHGSKWSSHELAGERGSFAEWEDSKYADPVRYREWFEHQTGLDADDWADGFAIRNHNTTTIAPTGTTGMVGNTTGGCEPIYNVAYYKNVSDDVQGDEMLVEFDDYFLRVLEANDIDVETVKVEAQAQMANNEFDGVEGLDSVPDAIGELFVITADLSGIDHAAVQCACQAGVDSAISKTCNFPNSATKDDMREVFEYIYDHGGKGVTVYRDGTRSKQVLTTRADNTEFADEDEAAEVLLDQIVDVFGGIDGFLGHDEVRAVLEAELAEEGDGGAPTALLAGEYARKRPRPDVLYGVTQRIDTGYGKLYVNINEDELGRPFELFANIGNSGGFTSSFTEALAKTISTALRAGVDPDEIANELRGIRSPKVAWDKGQQINSIPDAIGIAMRRYLDGEVDRAYPQQRNLDEVVEERSPPKTDGGAGVDVASADPEDLSQSLIDAGESPECPDCGSLSLHFTEGCKTCASCGWSEC